MKVMMVFTVGCRMSETSIKARTFNHDCILVPDSLVVITHCIFCIEDTYAITPCSDVSEGSVDQCTCILLRRTCDAEKKILVCRDVRIAGPWTDVVSRNTRACYIHPV